MSEQLLSSYPEANRERDAWIVAQRGPRNSVSPRQPYAFHVEPEYFADGSVGEVATLFLTNRECPWRCAMCDLWRNTLTSPVSAGDIPRQIEYALERLPRARQIKLYNSGSFFDTGAIPPGDLAAIASLLRGFERVIVECHPSLVGPACPRFLDLLGVELEVAMGLETVHPETLAKLNKRMTLETYRQAAGALGEWTIALRSFVLLQPPFLPATESVFWACRALDFARDCRATAIAVIPTRGGNGAMETLARLQLFREPTVYALEEVMAYGLQKAGGSRVFADLWDFERFARCEPCRQEREQRLQRMNFSQKLQPPVTCARCGDAA